MKHALGIGLALSFATGCDGEGPGAEVDETGMTSGGGKADDGTDAATLEDGFWEDSNPDLRTELTAKYGTRPRIYTGFFNRSNEAERIFDAELDDVLADVNARARARGYTNLGLTEAAIATNFITEGGFYALNDNMLTGLDGYGTLGIDTIVSNAANLRPWLHPDVIALIDDPAHHQDNVNERGETYTSLTDLTFEEGMYANAGMFAYSCALASDDAGREWDDLDTYGKFFWCTTYFNAGPGTGRSLMRDEGLDSWDEGWDRADDHYTYGTNARFNASWRTSSFEYLHRAVRTR